MNNLLVLPVIGPVLAAALLVVLPYRRLLHRLTGLATTVGVLGLAATLVPAAAGAVPVVRVGGWPPPVAISFAADPFTVLMLLVSAVVVTACLAFAAGTGEDREPTFVPLVLLMSAGAYGAFLTTDLFNLFVLVEVMLVPSYVLLGLRGGPVRLRAGHVYVATNLLASTILIAGVGLVYGAAGTVSLGELTGTARDSAVVALAGGVVLLALGLKAAVVPAHAWLPRTYPYAAPAVAALFSGLLTKVGLYAIIRVYATVFAGAPAYRWLILVVAVAGMVVGVLGAVGDSGLRSLLSFHMVSQIGYVLLGLAMFSVVSLAAALFYLAQYILVKAALFLCAGAIQTGYRTDRLDRLGGLAASHPLLACTFAGAALSLAGLPPFSGFLAKYVLLRAAADARDWLALTVAAVVGLLTLLSMLKVWSLAFWGAPDASVAGRTGVIRPVLVLPALLLVLLSLGSGIFAQPLLHFFDRAAAGLADPTAYVRAVTGR